MTVDEWAGGLYSKHGYLVLGDSQPRTIGEILPKPLGVLSELSVPLKKIGESDRDEYHRFWLAAGCKLVDQSGPYFYRVEAAD